MSESPYRTAALEYWQAGWRGVLPLPPNSKKLIMKGWTGHEGDVPSFPDVQAWMDGSEGNGNIAIRVPHGVVGIDIDDYGTKQGAATIARLEAAWGPLPSTWRSTARPEKRSGIYFYRVPPGLRWPGQLGDNVEVVQFSHRYAVVWPSINPDAGARYEWYGPNEVESAPDGMVPTLDDLPDLPPPWVDGITAGALAELEHKAMTSAAGVNAWVHSANRAEPCRMVRHAITQTATRFRHGSRHDVLNAGVMAVVRLADGGHGGLMQALATIRDEFERSTADATRGHERDDRELQSEWERSLSGAVGRVLADRASGPLAGPCACDDDPGSLVPTPVSPGPQAPAQPVAGPGPDLEHFLGDPYIADAGASLIYAGPLESTPLPDPVDELVVRLRQQREARRRVDAEEAIEAAGKRERPLVVVLTDELAKPDDFAEYTIDRIMPHESNVLLAAQFKAGKTTMMGNAIRSLADGVPFLGCFEVAQSTKRIAFLNYEVSERMFRRWLRQMAIKNTDAVIVVNLRGYSLRLTDPTDEDWLVGQMIGADVGTIIVDPFAPAFAGQGDENSNPDVTNFLDTLDRIKMRAGIPDLIMSAHTGRGTVEGKEHVRGASRLDDWPDVRWLLNKKDDLSYFRAHGRDVDYAERPMSFDDSTRTLTVIEEGPNRAVNRNNEVMEAVVTVIRREPGISSRQLREGVRVLLNGCTAGHTDTAVDTLVRANRIRVEFEGAGNAKNHYLNDPGSLAPLPPCG